jgi:hypothetical protein
MIRSLVEATFVVAQRLAQLSAESGKTVRIVDVHSWDRHPDLDGECSIMFDIQPAVNDGVLVVNVDARELAGLDTRAQILAAFTASDATRH